MGVSANLQSLLALQDFRGKLAEFRLDAIEALGSVDSALHDMHDWLIGQQKHWQHQAQKRSEDVIRARRELEERKNAPGKRGYSDQELAHRKAKQRLQEAEEKVERCRAWQRLLPQYENEYQGPARMLGGFLETDIAKAVAVLGVKLEILEQYAALHAPREGSAAGLGSQSSTGEIAAGVVETNEATDSPVVPAEGDRR